jgi:hypothetical protein
MSGFEFYSGLALIEYARYGLYSGLISSFLRLSDQLSHSFDERRFDQTQDLIREGLRQLRRIGVGEPAPYFISHFNNLVGPGCSLITQVEEEPGGGTPAATPEAAADYIAVHALQLGTLICALRKGVSLADAEAVLLGARETIGNSEDPRRLLMLGIAY